MQELGLDIITDLTTFAVDYLPIFLIVAFLIALMMWILAHLSRYIEYLKLLENPYLDKETLEFVHKVLVGLGVGMFVILILFVLQFRIIEIRSGLIAFVNRLPALFFVIFVIFIAAVLVRILHRFASYLRGELKVKPRKFAPPRALTFTELFLKYFIYAIAGVIAFLGGLSTLPSEDQQYRDMVFPYITAPQPSVILGFVVAIIVIFIVSRFIESVFEDMKKRTTKFPPKVIEELKSTAKYAVYITGAIIILLLVVDLILTPEKLLVFTVAVIFIGLIIAFLIFDSIRSGLSGVTLMLADPFNEGDQVKIDNEIECQITSMGLIGTQVRTEDGNVISIPNSELLKRSILNVTRSVSGTILINFALEFDVPRERVEAVMMEAVGNTKGINANPPPKILCKNIRGSLIDYQLIAKTKDIFGVAEIKSELIANIQQSFIKESLKPKIS